MSTAGAVPVNDGPWLVPRPRLVARLRAGARGRVTVLSAPAGYGKRALLDQWRAVPDVAPWMHMELGALTPHLSPSEIARHLERSSLDMHVVATCRSRWPWVLGGTQLRCDVAVLDERDLAFNRDEARVLLFDVSGRALTERQVDALLDRTQGWAVGLRAAALGLRRADPDAFVDDFGGDDAHVSKFFAHEVLAEVPERFRRFLRRTSVLHGLDGPSGVAVSGDPAAGAILHMLERRGLFARRCDPIEERFAYHPLFRDHLRQDLRVVEPPTEAEVLRRAAQWHEREGRLGEAADHLMEATDWDALLRLADRHGRSLFERGATGEVLRWVDAIPATHCEPRELALRRAYLNTIVGRVRLAKHLVDGLRDDELSRGEALVVDSLRSTWSFWNVAPESVIETADRALGCVDDLDPAEIPDVFELTTPDRLRTMAATSRARALWYAGDVAASRRALSVLVHRPGTYPPWRVHALGALGLLEAWAGNLTSADRYARESLAVAASGRLLGHPASIDARLALARVSRERGLLHAAERHLGPAQHLATAMFRPALVVLGTIERALCDLAAGAPARAKAAIDRNRASGDPPAPPAIARRLLATEVRVLLALGDVPRAQAVLDTAEEPVADLVPVAVQAAVARRDLVAARALLGRRHPGEDEPAARLEHELWLAILDAESGDRRRALPRAAAVVEAARAEGHVRLLLDAGPPAERLLRALAHRTPSRYLWHVLRAAPAPATVETSGVRGAVTLSDRELEVVRHLPSAMSSAEIAAQLFISLNTLKTHLRAVYRKLGVKGRREAIERAEELGLA